MKSKLLFDFIADKEKNTITIKREFDAAIELVWKAWTTPEILEQWIAPKPWRTETKTMDFREGGFWHYAMVSPRGEKHWTRYDYQKIVPQKSITELRGFCDESGAVDPDFSRTLCQNIFTEQNGKTRIIMTAQYGSPEVLKYMVTHGFKEGVTDSFENLDKVLASLKKK